MLYRCYQLIISPFNPLNAELNPIRHLLALVGARHIVHVSRIRVNISLLSIQDSCVLRIPSNLHRHKFQGVSGI